MKLAPLALGLIVAGVAPLGAMEAPAERLALTLPGDDTVGLSPETQDWVEIAPGGPGYLLVWEDRRADISGSINQAGPPLSGNGIDIYAAVVDSDGNPLTDPIIVDSQGMNQTRPRAAWNGENWLVVWTTQRPTWYFFDDIVGVRISPTGDILDPEPLPIRLELNNPANFKGNNPRLTSDGENWLVVWEDHTVSGNQNVSGRRIASDGSFIDPEPAVLNQYNGVVFGPEDPQIAWATDEYLLVWEQLGVLYSQRFDSALQPIDPSKIRFATGASDPRLATDGQNFLVISRENLAFRFNHAGEALDPSGIDFDSINGTGFQPSGGTVSWEGSSWLIVFPSSANALADSDLYVVRLAPDGTIVPPGATALVSTGAYEWKPSIATSPSGGSQVAWSERAGLVPETIRGLQLASGGTSGTTRDLGVGLPRQTYLSFSSADDHHLAVFVSENGGELRLVSQRIDSTGQAIDPEPTVLTTRAEGPFLYPDVSFNGVYHLVVWWDSAGSVYGQRVDLENNLVDPSPVVLVSNDRATSAAVGALGDTFLLAYTFSVSSDLQYIKAARIDGQTLAMIDTPFVIGFDFALAPDVAGLGDRWLVAWEDQVSHDISDSDIAAVWVNADGSFSGSFRVDQAGFGNAPDIAVGSDRALITWDDDLSFLQGRVEGRILRFDGTFVGGEFLIADDDNEQILPRAGWDGSQFAVAWQDYRSIQGIEHKRADIFASRIGTDGTVLDPNGFALTSGPLSEDLPDVAGLGGSMLVGFSQQSGETVPEVQRIMIEPLTGGMMLSASGTCPGPVTVTVSGGPPSSEMAIVAAANTNGFTLRGQACTNTLFEIGEPFVLPPTFILLDTQGNGVTSIDTQPGRCWLEGMAFATCATTPALAVPQ